MDSALQHLRRNDPIIAELIDHYPIAQFTRHTNYYPELVDSIISQQLSVKAARTIRERFTALFDGDFPTPEEILAKDIETLRSVGLSRAKASYIQDLARHILDGSVNFDTIDTLSNDEIIAELTKVKGIGVWTVHMFLMFCMARLDVLPTGDLGIRNGVTRLYDLAHTATPDDVASIADENNWQPYASVASWYVWKSLDNVPVDL